ncbi:MAG: hypothetical protein GY823_14200, partial [Flavobacteriaceae bacterium]|nr:hypothetical protein [Flavobacteriaceae bacterium]
AKCFNNELNNLEKPDEWKESVTTILLKKSKPTAQDLRLLSLTNISYKMYMSLIKNEIEQHIKENDEAKETQAGFTEGGRTEDNLFILQYCVQETFKSRKQLVVIAVDYTKAYDSIDRKTIIETLIKYKIHPSVIDSIAEIYQGDKTIINLNSDT